MASGDAARQHFETIAATMAAEERVRRAEALRTTVAERVALGFLLGAVPSDDGIRRALDARADGQLELARRRRALSLG